MIHKQLCIIVSVIIIRALIASTLYPQQTPAQTTQQALQDPKIQHAVNWALRNLMKTVQEVADTASNSTQLANQSATLAHHANEISQQALEASTNTQQQVAHVTDLLTQESQKLEAVSALQKTVTQQAQEAAANLNNEYKRLSTTFAQDIIRNTATAKQQCERSLQNNIKMELAKIKAKQDSGVYKQKAEIQARATIEVGAEKWKNIREMITDPKTITKIVIAIIVTALCIYTIKYGLPALINYFTQPRVISETSKAGLFGWGSVEQSTTLDDLIFTPALQKQLSDLASRVQTAKQYHENLPNVLFYGVPGTGKTAFARELAYTSGLDYALTSGSEFAKITDLNTANDELRKLLTWAQNDDQGLLVFIDEAESLFANRKLSTTSKTTQDFINTFLSLISDQSQKNVMFVFATNHPFKLDDAITNRIGTSIEFTLPEAPERARILLAYIAHYAQENEEAIVELPSDIIQRLPSYAEGLKDFSPRAIKFVAEEMIINARRQAAGQLTNDIAQAVINEAHHSLQQITLWEKERNKWGGALPAAQMQQ